MNETEIAKLLEEGLRHYAVGDPSRALEAWFKVLEAVPQHARALEYVEYVRKSYRVDNDASALTPIVGETAQGAERAAIAESALPVVELVDAVATASPTVSAEPASAVDAAATALPTVSAAPASAVDAGATAVPSGPSTSEAAVETPPPPAPSAPSAAPTTGEWTVEVSHVSSSAPSSTTHLPTTEPPASPASTDWGVAASMDWGAAVDDGDLAPSSTSTAPVETAVVATTTRDAPPALASAEAESMTGAEVVDSASSAVEPGGGATDSASSSTTMEAAERAAAFAPLPPTAAVAGLEDSEPSGPVVVAARWTTEAQPAGAEDRAAHGGFEDPSHAVDDWGSGPIRPGAQVRAGSTAVVEIAETESGEATVDAPVLEAAAPSATIIAPESAAESSPTAEPRAAEEAPEEAQPTALVADTAATPVVDAPSAREAMSDSTLPVEVATAAEAEVTVPEGRRPSLAPAPPATLLDASWGDIVDDDAAALAATSSAPDSSASAPADAPPAMHVVVDERTPASTKVANTEEGGPPPANPSELQSDDRSAPTLHLSDEPQPPPSPVQGGADVLVFPTPKALEKSANDDASEKNHTRDAGDFSDLPKTASESDVSPSTAESNPISSTEEPFQQKASAPETPETRPASETPAAPVAPATPAMPASPFRAVAIQESNEEWSGVHRSSRVSDSSIVVNPNEEARKVGVDSETSKPNNRAVVKDAPKRVLRFDSYEGDAVTSGEGLPVDDAAESLARLETEHTERTLRAPVTPSSSEDAAAAADKIAPASASTNTSPSEGPTAFGDVPTTGPDGKPASPWDAFSGDSDSIDLDQTKTSRNVFEDLLSDEERARRAAENGTAVVARSPESAEADPVVDAAAIGDTEPVNQCAALMDGARELFALGDFSGSLELVEKVLRIEPENAEAKSYFQKNEGTLLKMYASKLGDLRRSPRVLTRPDEVIWMNLHHRAGFVLSQVDGTVTYEDIAEISGMSRLETYRILAELVQNGVITS